MKSVSDLSFPAALVASCVPWLSGRAAPLPPRFHDQTIGWEEQVRGKPQIKAARVDFIDRAPIAHGRIEWIAAGVARVLTPDGSRWMSWDIEKGKSLPGLAPVGNAPVPGAVGSIINHRIARLGWTGRKLELREGGEQVLWSIDAGFTARGTAWAQNAFSAWRSFPTAQLFQLNPNGDTVHRVAWNGDSQIVYFGQCAGTRAKSVVVENVRNGLARIVYLGRGLDVVGYTIYDLGTAATGAAASPNTGRGEITGVAFSPVARDACEDFLLAGAFGLLRIKYPPQSVQSLE